MSEALADVFVFAAAAALISGCMAYWRRAFPPRLFVVYFFAVLLFFSPALLTSRHQVPTDIAFLTLPWADRVSQRVTPENPLLLDPLLQILPYRKLVRDRLKRGEIPFWSHELGTGQPLLGNGQSAVLSPLHLLALLLPPERGLTVSAALTVFLTLLLMHALLAELGASTLGSVLGATAFAFSTFSVAWVYYQIMPTVAWLPGVVLALVLLRRGEERGLLGLIVCSGGAGLSGHPSTLVNVILVAAVVAGALFLKSGDSRARFALLTLLGVVLGAGLAAPALVPFVEAVSESHRFDVSSNAFRQEPRFEAERVLVAASPLAFGHPNDRTWSGPRNFSETATSYAGALTLGLALMGLATSRRNRLVLLGGTVALVAAIWRGGPRLVLPLLFRDADRLQFVWIFAVCVTASLAFTEIERSDGLPSRMLPHVGGAFALVVLLLRPPGGVWQQTAWVLALLSALGLVAWLLSRRSLRSSMGVLLVVLVGAELFVLGMGYNPALPARFRLGEPSAVRHLRVETRSNRPRRIIGEGHQFRAGLPALYGLWDPRGNDPMRPVHPFRLLRRLTTLRQGFHELKLEVSEATQPMLSYLGVGYVLTKHSRELPSPWQLEIDTAGGRVWANPDALPLFFAPRRVERKAPGRLWRVLENRDFGERAFVDMHEDGFDNGRVVVSAIEPVSNGFDLRLRAGSDALVVSSVSYSRLWTAMIEETATPVVLVNGAFLGFRVPSGEHSVELRYEPRFWTAAVALFAVSALAVLVLVYLGARPRPLVSS